MADGHVQQFAGLNSVADAKQQLEPGARAALVSADVMWLPELDPAGSPRVQASPRRKGPREENPYVPRGMPMAKSYRSGARSAPYPPEHAHDDMSIPTSSLKARVAFNGGAQTERLHEQRSPGRGSSASASMGTPRGMSDASLRNAQKKRLERLKDSYMTAHSRETLLSEQYDKELLQVRESLTNLRRESPIDRAKMELQSAVRTRVKLERRVSGFESKLNELETYNEKLTDMIGALRKQNEPHRQATKHTIAAIEKLAVEMAQRKALCHKALDERERCVDQLRHIQEESTADHHHFGETLEQLEAESKALDERNKQAMQTLEKATELAKRQQYSAMRTTRAKKERLEVRYGYLRSQLEGVDGDFRELQRIVGVHFVPSHPESLQEIINKFVEKEGRVASLHKYSALQNDEMQILQAQITALEAQAAAGEAALVDEAPKSDSRTGGSFKGGPSEGKAVDDEASMEEQFGSICNLLERMHLLAKCDEDPSLGGSSLGTKGCSSSTIYEFMSVLAAKLDRLEVQAATLRDVASQHRSTSVRKPNENVEGFLQSRSMACVMAGGAAEGDTGEHPGVTSVEDVKKMLPSISDQGDVTDGDVEATDGARRRERDAKKGAIDRSKRDQAISAWVQRQQEVRGAQTQRPSIRDFYTDGESQWPTRTVYPPASAR